MCYCEWELVVSWSNRACTALKYFSTLFNPDLYQSVPLFAAEGATSRKIRSIFIVGSSSSILMTDASIFGRISPRYWRSGGGCQNEVPIEDFCFSRWSRILLVGRLGLSLSAWRKWWRFLLMIFLLVLFGGWLLLICDIVIGQLWSQPCFILSTIIDIFFRKANLIY